MGTDANSVVDSAPDNSPFDTGTPEPEPEADTQPPIVEADAQVRDALVEADARAGDAGSDGPDGRVGPDAVLGEQACDLQDDDMDGVVDEDFDLSTDPNNCGQCGVVCGAGESLADSCVAGSCKISCDDDLPCGLEGSSRLVCGPEGYCAPLRQRYLKAENPGMHDAFGYSLAADREYLIVGAPWEQGDVLSNLDGAGDYNNNLHDGGAAYILRRGAEGWSQIDYLKPDALHARSRFGRSVAANFDAGFVLVGAVGTNKVVDGEEIPEVGTVFMFREAMGGQWREQAAIRPGHGGPNALFGASISLEGDRVAIGASQESIQGVTPRAGAAYLYERTGRPGMEAWEPRAFVRAEETGQDDGFGHAVALQGNTLVVGALFEDGADRDDPSSNGSVDSGAVYVFTRNDDGGVGNEDWGQTAYLKADPIQPSSEFGRDVAIDRNIMVVGAPGDDEGAGAAYIFVRQGDEWVLNQRLMARHPHPGARFGTSVAIHEGRVYVGSTGEQGDWSSTPSEPNRNALPPEDNDPGAGAVFLFEHRGVEWREIGYVKTSDAEGGDGLGVDIVPLRNDGFAAGAFWEWGDGLRNVECNEPRCFNNSVPRSGAVFIFETQP